MTNIETELDALIAREGGYSNDPQDNGGETMYGITKHVADAFGYVGAMKDMSKEQAKEIYRKRYWIQPGFDKVFALSPAIAMECFDSGVNMGVSTASKFLQRSLNVLNNSGVLFPDMAVDGGIGAMTLCDLSKFLDARKKDGEIVLLRMLNALQSVRYIEIAEGNTSQEKFVYGWQFNRVGM